MIQAIDLEAIEARANAATAGPWVPEEHRGHWSDWTDWVVLMGKNRLPYTVLEESDAAFIAHSREDIPSLIAEVRRLRAFIEELTVDGCSYGDGCPVFGSNHYRCLACRAKEALGG